jgi:DNA-binding beta-propeller fold protein YncE
MYVDKCGGVFFDAFVLLLYLCGFCALQHASADENKQTPDKPIQSYQAAGFTIDFSVATTGNNSPLKAGEEASVHFQITDTKSHKPIKGLSPVAWMARSHSDGATDSKQCEQKISELHQGHLSHQPEANLNSFLVLTLNQNNTISVVNPQIAWSRTKLEAVVELPGLGDAWVLDKSRDHLYVVVPEQASIIVIDTNNWHQTTTIKLGENGKSSNIFLQPDGRLLWLAFDKQNEIFAVNTTTNQVVARIPIGNGEHKLSGSLNGQQLLVSDIAPNSLTVIDTETLKPLSTIQLDNPPTAVTVNPITGLLYVASKEANAIQVFNPQELKITNSIAVDKGVTELRFNHEGNYGFALIRERSTVSLIDATKQKIIASSRVIDEPDQVVFSHHYAYVRGLASPQYSVFDLFQVAKGVLAPANVEAGQLPANQDSAAITHLDMVAPTPDGHGAILANAPDKKLYYYMEGMMAASGSLDNGGQAARGLMILDRSLKEMASSGNYKVDLNLPASGEYDVPFVLDKLRIKHCFHVTVEPAQDQTKLAKVNPQITPISSLLTPTKDEVVDLRYKVTEPISQKPVENLHDVELLIVASSGHWQSKHRMAYEGAGNYSYKQKFTKPGKYLALLRIPSLGMGYSRGHQIHIEVPDYP